MGSLIVLIGAGASFDAGMPLVTQLTGELRDRLVSLRDINGKIRPEFPELFDVIAEYDPDIRQDYERFFEWIGFLQRAQTGPFRKATRIKLDRRLVDAVPFLTLSIKLPIWAILRDRHKGTGYKPSYYARLGDLLPAKGRLKVFTTNYDLCVEDACRGDGLDVTTGFDPRTGRRRPALFRSRGPGINLYKLHGSLNWGLRDIEEGAADRPLVERYPLDWKVEPELLLGPGSKLQSDDPYVTLYSEFHQALRGAKTCVAIGCSFRDPHIAGPIREASKRGMRVIDVNPASGVRFPQHKSILLGAKKALESGAVLEAVGGQCV